MNGREPRDLRLGIPKRCLAAGILRKAKNGWTEPVTHRTPVRSTVLLPRTPQARLVVRRQRRAEMGGQRRASWKGLDRSGPYQDPLWPGRETLSLDQVFLSHMLFRSASTKVNDSE